MSQPPKTPSAPAQPSGPSGPPSQHHGPEHKGLLDEDHIHVPKGIPRWQFVFLIGLMIFLLVIWLVPNATSGIFSGGRDRNPIAVSWERPGHGTEEWRTSELVAMERSFEPALQLDRYLQLLLGVNPSRIQPEDYVRLIVLDRLAEDSGLRITDADLAQHLTQVYRMIGLSSAEEFREYVRVQLGIDQANLEENIRRGMRVQRFLALVGYAGSVPSPTKIEEQWQRDHAEFAFEYSALKAETLKDEARQSLPDDAGLKAWFDALPEGERETFKTAEKRKAEYALYRGGEENPGIQALLAAFPEPAPAEGVTPPTPEERARTYYDNVFFRRFLKPADPAQDPSQPQPLAFLGFEEVQAQALAEAPVYFALQRWLEGLEARKTNGETIDFVAEAGQYGLEHAAVVEAHTREEFGTLSDVGDRELADAVFTAAPDGSFYGALVVGPSGLSVVRVNERSAPEMPPFEDLREKLIDKWLEPKTRELAVERLKKVWEGLESFTAPVPEGQEPPKEPVVHKKASAEAFRAAAEGAGLVVGERSWLDRAGPASKDPQWAEDAHKFLFAQAGVAGLYALEPDEVAKPVLARDGSAAYLVRLTGKREVPLTNMSPSDYDRYKGGASSEAFASTVRGMDLAFLEQTYGLKMLRGDERAEARAKAASNQPTDDQ